MDVTRSDLLRVSKRITDNKDAIANVIAEAVTDHGSLTGLTADGHAQYLNTTRHAAIGNNPHGVGISDLDTSIINVKHAPKGMVGAAGDGSTDDTTTLQALVDYIGTMGGGTLFFPKGTYKITSALTINNRYTCMHGEGIGESIISVTGGSNDGIIVQGTSATSANWCQLSNFTIMHTTTPTAGTGITLNYTAVTKLKDIHIADFAQGVYMEHGNNTLADRLLITCSSGSVDAIGCNIVGENVSSVFTNCWYDMQGCTGNTVGIKCSGDHVNDYIFDNPQFAGVKQPMVLDASAATWATDIMIRNVITDGSVSSAIYLKGFSSASSVVIDGGWINHLTGQENVGVYVDGCNGIAIRNVQFNELAGGSTYHYGVKILGNSDGVSVEGCVFVNTKYAVHANYSENAIIKDNTIYNESGQTGYMGIYAANSSLMNVSGNSIAGYFTYGLYLDSTVSNSIASQNIVDATNITTPITVLGTTNVVINNIPDSTWTTPTMLNSWASLGSGFKPVGYRKVGNRVFLRGVLTGGTLGQAAFTLPAGCRPPYAGWHETAERLDIYTNGNVTPMAGSTTYFPLDGVSFFIN